MSDTNHTLDLTEEPVVTEPITEVVEDEPIVSVPVAVEPEESSEPSVPSTEEVVETVQSILTDVPSPAPAVATKTTDERLDALIELLKSTYHQYEYDDNEFSWSSDYLKIREALNEL